MDVHKSFGFEFLTDMYDMEDYSNEIEAAGGEEIFYNWMEDGQRNLDSEMIEICKNEMFPTDERFYTYITTITMHGVYYERGNLEKHREKLLQYYQPDEDDDDEMILYNYMQTAMEFDTAIGCMMEDLEKKGLLDNTVITIFGDHNAYYQQLSNYVKGIKKYKNTEGNYTDLFKVPFIIYDQDLANRIRQDKPEFTNKPITVDKFACTSDIMPTLLDLLGIRYYTNLLYGTSAFAEKQSVLYSRAYDIFVSDGIVGRSVNNLLFRDESVTEEMFETYRATAIELVDKIKHCDYIFLQDYFDEKGKLELYHQKMHAINP
jgi:phosphoglycerol transferase MdoB-like AlkP superfamily enzyme